MGSHLYLPESLRSPLRLRRNLYPASSRSATLFMSLLKVCHIMQDLRKQLTLFHSIQTLYMTRLYIQECNLCAGYIICLYSKDENVRSAKRKLTSVGRCWQSAVFSPKSCYMRPHAISVMLSCEKNHDHAWCNFVPCSRPIYGYGPAISGGTRYSVAQEPCSRKRQYHMTIRY